MEEYERLKNEPLTRYDIDISVEEEMKRKEKFGDPLKLFKKNNLNLDEHIGKRTFYLPKCKFTAPPNRFGIEPGYGYL